MKESNPRNDGLRKLTQSLLVRCRQGQVHQVKLEAEFIDARPDLCKPIHGLVVSDIALAYATTLRKYGQELRKKMV